MASWMVATPNRASFATISAGARSMARTAIPDLPIISFSSLSRPLCVTRWPDVSRDADFAAHDQSRRAQQRRALDLRRIFRAHRQRDGKFTGWMLHRKILVQPLGDSRHAIRNRPR